MKRRLLLVLAVVVAALAAGSPAAAKVEIFHIQYNPPGRDSGTNASLNLEAVYLWNNGQAAVSLRGWTLRDRQGNVYRFRKFTLRPFKYVAVLTGRGRNSADVLHWGRKSYVWDNGGDVATLRKPNGRTVDRCRYRGNRSGEKKCYKDVEQDL